MNTKQLRQRHGIPESATLKMPENWHPVGEVEELPNVPIFQYKEENKFATEVGLLLSNRARFQVKHGDRMLEFLLFTV